jgi:hypothetical protein
MEAEDRHSYREDLRIDPEALDIELLRQPQLMMYYSEKLTDAKKKYDRARENADVVRSQVDKKIRENAEKKLTEAQINAMILADDKFKVANSEVIDAKYEVNIYVGAIDALNHKKSSIKGMIELAHLNYFVLPSAPRDLPREVESFIRKKSVDNNLVERIKRRRERARADTD